MTAHLSLDYNCYIGIDKQIFVLIFCEAPSVKHISPVQAGTTGICFDVDGFGELGYFVT